MVDLEFEDFPVFNTFLPKQFTAPALSYTLAHAITPLEENKSFLEKVELGGRLCGIQETQSFISDRESWRDSLVTDLWEDSSYSDGFEEDNYVEDFPPRPEEMQIRESKDEEGGQVAETEAIENPPDPQKQVTLTGGSEQQQQRTNLGSGSADDGDEDLDPEEIITSEDRDRILEIGRNLFDSLLLDEEKGDDGVSAAKAEDTPERSRELERADSREEGKPGSSRGSSDLSGPRRRRRKLPDIPKDKKPLEGVRQASLFDELTAATPSWENRTIIDPASIENRSSGNNPFRQSDTSINQLTRDILTSLTETLDSTLPPALLLHLVNIDKDDEHGGDIDSGNSTSHSPEEHSRNYRTRGGIDLPSPISPSLSTAANRLELLDPTHRGLHRFVPRHHDEIEIDIGDPVYVQKEAEDLWCEGINLRTGKQGIFPEAHVVDVDYNDFDPAAADERKERYILDYLGSIRCTKHKGSQVITQAVQKTSGAASKRTCVLEIGEKGIKMVDKTVAGDIVGGDATQEYFYHLKNVTFCGFHPRDHRYFAFITKHPSPCVQKYACHVFSSENSTRCVAEAYGRAFHRFYKTFIDTQFPTEDIYLE